MKRSDTDDLWIKIESLQWVLFVIFCNKDWEYGCDFGLCQSTPYFHSQDLGKQLPVSSASYSYSNTPTMLLRGDKIN